MSIAEQKGRSSMLAKAPCIHAAVHIKNLRAQVSDPSARRELTRGEGREEPAGPGLPIYGLVFQQSCSVSILLAFRSVVCTSTKYAGPTRKLAAPPLSQTALFPVGDCRGYSETFLFCR